MAKPVIRKNGDVWTVYIRDRAWNTRATWNDAMLHANRIARFSHQIRMRLDITRITAALDRMENR